MATMTHAIKEKRTFSLSHDVVEYLETGCAQTHAPSLSAYLERLVRDLQSRVEMEKLEASTLSYYDNLSDSEVEEQADWGRVGSATLVNVNG